MIVLAVDSSAVSASAALVKDGTVLGEFYTNAGLTHSQTLLPMVSAVLECARVSLCQVDLFAVSAGPGSFTGVRIGVASIKGLAFAQNKPCVGVSTLEAMALNLQGMEGLVCAVMDARCGQVYNALFCAQNGALRRLTPDRALSVSELAQECERADRPVWLVGDGAKVCSRDPRFHALGAKAPPEPLLYQRACQVAAAAQKAFETGGAVSAAELAPLYLRPPQAQRMLKKTLNKEQGESSV